MAFSQVQKQKKLQICFEFAHLLAREQMKSGKCLAENVGCTNNSISLKKYISFFSKCEAEFLA